MKVASSGPNDTRAEPAQGERVCRGRHPQGGGPVLEERRSAALLLDRLTLGPSQNAPFRGVEVDGLRDLVGEQRVAGPLDDGEFWNVGRHASTLRGSARTGKSHEKPPGPGP